MYMVLKLKKVLTYILLISAGLLLAVNSFTVIESIGKTPGNPGEVQVPIIMYHSITKNKSDRYTISPDRFESDLRVLKENNFNTVVMRDLIDYVHYGIPLPENPIVLTFDDGYYNNYYYALPLLEKYDMKAVISVVGEFTDKSTSDGKENPNYSNLSWEHIRNLTKSGRIEIQNHSYYLHDRKKGREGASKKKSESLEEYREVLTSDLVKLQERLFDQTGILPTTFTYPFGPISKDILKEIGFSASLSFQEGINGLTFGDTDCLFNLSRCIRSNSISVERILRKYDMIFNAVK